MEEEGPRKKRKEFTEVEKLSITAYANLFRNSQTKKFDYGTRAEVTRRYNVSASSLVEMVTNFDKEIETGALYPSFKHKYTGSKPFTKT